MQMWVWLILTVLPLIAQGPQKPYFDFSTAGSGFFGPGRELPDPVGLTSIRIGVLGPAKEAEGLQMRTGVRMALEEMNRRGGYQGIPYEMVFRPDDGPWGMAAKQVVDFAYEDQVWTIIGGLDSQRTHIAELVVSKAWVPVVTPSASDMSIDYANVPWVFRCAPDNSREAELLLDYARRQGYKHVVAVTEAQRDGHTGFLRLQEATGRKNIHLDAHWQFPTGSPEAAVPNLLGSDSDALILWGSPGPSLTLLRAIRAAGIKTPVLGPASLASADITADSGWIGELVVAAPYDLSRQNPELLKFSARFKDLTGMLPTPIALLSYDATLLVGKAMVTAGLNRMRIRDELARMSYDGIAGKIEFNSLRGSTREPVILTFRNGSWERLNNY
jgi:branched-chain amino acid transport system substrate-binding protein